MFGLDGQRNDPGHLGQRVVDDVADEIPRVGRGDAITGQVRPRICGLFETAHIPVTAQGSVVEPAEQLAVVHLPTDAGVTEVLRHDAPGEGQLRLDGGFDDLRPTLIPVGIDGGADPIEPVRHRPAKKRREVLVADREGIGQQVVDRYVRTCVIAHHHGRVGHRPGPRLRRQPAVIGAAVP